MLGLVEADLAPTRKLDLGYRAPSGFLYIRAVNSLLREGGHLGLEAIAHEIQLVTTVAVRRVYGQFRRGQGEDQPPCPASTDGYPSTS
jgi:hypothetical protein